jgi:hypothetical protein
MPTAPKSISIQDLSGAVGKAVSAAKLKLPPLAGPFAYINPGIICGLIIFEEFEKLQGAQQLASTIAKHVSDQAGINLPPVVQNGAVGAPAVGGAPKLPNHIICGFKHDPQFNVHF